MTDTVVTLTGNSTLGTWLDDPTGLSLLEDALEPTGITTESLAPARGIALNQLVALSQGALPQTVVDDLVLRANDGVMPADDTSFGFQEKITAGRFTGKTVVVTGAGSGIGRATASRVAREGGRVIAVDVAEKGLTALKDELPDADLTTVVGDITNQQSVDAIAAAAGPSVDALANVAGINDDFSPLHETSDATWERVLGVNLTGAFKLSRAILPAMLANGRGAIVNIASEAGLRGNASGNAYTVSKHGVIGLTKSAAFMYGPQGVRVNAIAPGGVATGIPMPAHVSEVGAARLAPFQAAIPTLATAVELAASISFLLSDDSVNINGVVLPSDGGWAIQ